jgi:hypothetical protein
MGERREGDNDMKEIKELKRKLRLPSSFRGSYHSNFRRHGYLAIAICANLLLVLDSDDRLLDFFSFE